MSNDSAQYNATLSFPSDKPVQYLHECLAEGNRRGKLPEIIWIDDYTFNLILPSKPLLTTLTGIVTKPSDNNINYNINFRLNVQRYLLHIFIWLTILSLVIGLPISFMIWPWTKIWWITALIIISSVFSILWMWFKWPAKSLADADSLLPDWIEVIRSRLE